MSLLLSVLVAVSFPQEVNVDLLVERLGHEDPDARDKAEKRLLEIGETARQGVLLASYSSNVELRTRASRILAAWDLVAVRERSLGPAWKVTLAEGEYGLGDLQRVLTAFVPVPLEMPATLVNSRVRLGKADGTPVWRFLDQLCEAHGGLAIPLDRPQSAFSLVAGKPSRAPTCYAGPFRIWIDKLTLEARHPYGQEWKGARMVLAVAWQPNVHPIGRDYLSDDFDFKITEITDEKGALIKDQPTSDPEGEGFTHDRTWESCWRRSQDFAYPKAEVRRLGRIKGNIKLAFPSTVRMVEFSNPSIAVGKKKTFGSSTVALSSYQRTEAGVLVELQFSRSEDKEKGIGLLSRWSNSSIKLRGKDGSAAVLEVRSRFTSSGSGNEGARVSGFFPLKAEVESLSFPFVEDHFEHEIPFEFTDVELP
ncbi:MAG TPA: hypothetical protein VF950_22550 [Planctomycetota bacterium]